MELSKQNAGHHETFRQSARLDGRHRRHDGRLGYGLPVCSLSLGFTGRDLNGRDDRQFDQHRSRADGNAVAWTSVEDGRGRAVKEIPASPIRLSHGLHRRCSSCLNLLRIDGHL